MGVAEVDVNARIDGERAVLSHFGALVPGDGSDQVGGQRLDLDGHRGADRLGAVVDGEVQQHDIAGGPLHQGADGGVVVLGDDQVAFPVAGHGAVFDLGGTIRDHHHV